MKSKIIEIIAILITILGITVSIMSLNKNNLGFVELGNYSVVNSHNNLLIAKDNGKKIDISEKVVYIYYANKKLSVESGLIKKEGRINTNNEKIYKIQRGSSKVNINSSSIIGTQVVSIPILGLILDFLYTRDGFLILIVFPLLIICIYELIKYIDGVKNIKDKN